MLLWEKFEIRQSSVQHPVQFYVGINWGIVFIKRGSSFNQLIPCLFQFKNLTKCNFQSIKILPRTFRDMFFLTLFPVKGKIEVQKILLHTHFILCTSTTCKLNF